MNSHVKSCKKIYEFRKFYLTSQFTSENKAATFRELYFLHDRDYFWQPGPSSSRQSGIPMSGQQGRSSGQIWPWLPEHQVATNLNLVVIRVQSPTGPQPAPWAQSSLAIADAWSAGPPPQPGPVRATRAPT